MSDVDLTEQQKELLRNLVQAYQDGAAGAFRWLSNLGDARIDFNGIERQIPAKYSDMGALISGDFITFRITTRGAGEGTLRPRAYEAVANHFGKPPPPPSAADVGGDDAGGAGTHVPGTIGEWLEQLTRLQDRVSGLDRRDRDLMLILHDLIEEMREVEESPDEAAARLAIVLDRARPWVELAIAIVGIKNSSGAVEEE